MPGSGGHPRGTGPGRAGRREVRGPVPAAPAPRRSAAGLLALMLLTDARHPARTRPDGSLAPLAEQDRGLWNRVLIDEGVDMITRTLRRGPWATVTARPACMADATCRSTSNIDCGSSTLSPSGPTSRGRPPAGCLPRSRRALRKSMISASSSPGRYVSSCSDSLAAVAAMMTSPRTLDTNRAAGHTPTSVRLLRELAAGGQPAQPHLRRRLRPWTAAPGSARPGARRAGRSAGRPRRRRRA